MFLWFIVSFLSSLYLKLYSPFRKPNCRCLFGEDCWPGDADFSALAFGLSQPLLHPLPTASVCYSSLGPGNCSEAQKQTANGFWRSDQVGGMQCPDFESYIHPDGTVSGCYINTTLAFPCSQGSVPVVGVDARTVQDVQAAVNFASKHNLRLVVKNTG
jgi:hypothetical protein